MEVAELKDFELVQQWNAAFCREAGVPTAATPERLRGLVQAGEMFLWKIPQPVSMAVAVQPTPNGIRVSGVYTPPGHRRKGYATALVAALSQRLLDSGRKFCFLFADLANPTSNGIYERIGYEPVCDFQEYDFVRSERNGDAALGAGAGR
jgi:hypothetical protein